MFPTPFVLQVERYDPEGSTDGHGNTVPSYGTPTDWHVHGIAPGSMAEPNQAGRDLSLIAYTVLAPVSDEAPGEYDRVVVDGDEYDVEGRPADWSRGPWPFPSAGLTVELKRAEG